MLIIPASLWVIEESQICILAQYDNHYHNSGHLMRNSIFQNLLNIFGVLIALTFWWRISTYTSPLFFYRILLSLVFFILSLYILRFTSIANLLDFIKSKLDHKKTILREFCRVAFGIPITYIKRPSDPSLKKKNEFEVYSVGNIRNFSLTADRVWIKEDRTYFKAKEGRRIFDEKNILKKENDSNEYSINHRNIDKIRIEIPDQLDPYYSVSIININRYRLPSSLPRDIVFRLCCNQRRELLYYLIICNTPKILHSYEKGILTKISRENQIDNIIQERYQLNDLHIESLDLSKMKLKQLPEEIWNLNFINDLDVSNNQIKDLPNYRFYKEEDMFEHDDIFSKYNWYDFIQNTNTIQEKIFKKFIKLKSIDLSFNKIREFPEVISKFKHIEKLNMSHNKIQLIPSFLKELEHLRYLDLSGNPLLNISKKQKIWIEKCRKRGIIIKLDL